MGRDVVFSSSDAAMDHVIGGGTSGRTGHGGRTESDVLAELRGDRIEDKALWQAMIVATHLVRGQSRRVRGT